MVQALGEIIVFSLSASRFERPVAPNWLHPLTPRTVQMQWLIAQGCLGQLVWGSLSATLLEHHNR